MQKGTTLMELSPSLILAAHPVPLRGISSYATSCGFRGYKSAPGINPIRVSSPSVFFGGESGDSNYFNVACVLGQYLLEMGVAEVAFYF